MAVSTPEEKTRKPLDENPAGDPLPYQPPEESFWHRYSFHGEFPIALFATIAIHVAIGAILIYILHLQFKGKKEEELTPVPTRGLKIADGERGGEMGNPGGGGGEPKKEITEQRPTSEPQRPVPQIDLKKELITASNWVPDLKDNPEALERIIQSPGYDRLSKLNDDLKRRMAAGFSGGAGKGTGTGSGNNPGNGAGGTGGKGDSSTSGNRSVRWTILFNNRSGSDYLRQITALGAKLIIPDPDDPNKNILFDDLKSKTGKPLSNQGLPEMFFVDNATDELGRADPSQRQVLREIAQALGLSYGPSQIVVLLPKNVEEDLARKERGYKGLREDQIYETVFSVDPSSGAITVKRQVSNAERKR